MQEKDIRTGEDANFWVNFSAGTASEPVYALRDSSRSFYNARVAHEYCNLRDYKYD